MNHGKKLKVFVFIILTAAAFLWILAAGLGASGSSTAPVRKISDHFDGKYFFNPTVTPPSESQARPSNPGIFWYAWRWIIGSDRPEWPIIENFVPGPPPATGVAKGAVRITPVGHATFLIQIDGLNILTDPIWSQRCSPVSWAGPRRHQPPGIRFEDLPSIDAILISHNHYDHLDLPTLRRLAAKGAPRALTTLGNLELIRTSGISDVRELDWWQSIALSDQVTLTLVPAQHFSSRTPWDRNETLWGGFMISGPSGNIYFAGDTGYGPHFREIARRFTPIRAALLPIAPFKPRQSNATHSPLFSIVHMGPEEAVQAHIDLGASLSIAFHFHVFQLGWDGFDDAVQELSANLKERTLAPDVFLAPTFGRAIELGTAFAGKDNSFGMAAADDPAWSSDRETVFPENCQKTKATFFR